MKALLLFPPHCLPYQPWSTLPALKAYLQAHDVDVSQRDLNIETYHRFLTPEYLRGARARLSSHLAALEQSDELDRLAQRRLLETLRAHANADRIIDSVEDAKRTLRDRHRFFDFAALSGARDIIAGAFEMISMAYYPSRITHETFEVPRAHETMRGLIEATSNADGSPFIDVFRSLPEWLRSEKPGVVGISISLQEQVLPGLTLSRVVKQALPDALVVLGGYTLSKVARRIAGHPEFFAVFADYLVVGEGERPLLGLIDALDTGRDVSRVAGLVGPSTDTGSGEPADYLSGKALLTPDYDGFPLDLYLSPEPVLALAASRGCYWGNCGFCDRGKLSGFPYRPRRASDVVDDLALLQARYGASHFTFTDDAIPPKMLRQLAMEIEGRRLDVRLSVDARFDPGFSPELCADLARAGFVHLRFGLESACERVLQVMKKGTRRATIEATLACLADSRVCTHLYVFFGFPGEQVHEAEETTDFVLRHEEVITSACCTTFGLLDQSPAFARPADFGITAVDTCPGEVFKYFFPHMCVSGLSPAQAKAAAARFFEGMERAYADFHVLGHLEWGHQFLYCARYGFKSPELTAMCIPDRRPRRSPWTQARHGVPTLHPDVVYYESRYDLPAVAEQLSRGEACAAAPNPSQVVYDRRSGRLASLSSHAAEIIRLCDSRRSVAEIAGILSTRYGLRHAELQDIVKQLLHSLWEDGVRVADSHAPPACSSAFP